MKSSNNTESIDPHHLQIIKYQPFIKASYSPSWLDLKVFYVRISNFKVDESTPEFLSLNHIPLTPDTLLEINGARTCKSIEGISSLLRRDRVDKKSEEATFVCTDSIRLMGSVKFEVYDKDSLVLSGVLEMRSNNGGEAKNNKSWNMNCEANIAAGSGFLKGKHLVEPDMPLLLPVVELYIAGCCSGTPIILTKTLQLSFLKKYNRKGTLDSIPELSTTDSVKDAMPGLDLQAANYGNYKIDENEEYNNMYWGRTEYMEGEDGEMSWFNAGVRVGVGIGLGICVGVGIGVGLLVRTYQTTTRNFKRRLL